MEHVANNAKLAVSAPKEHGLGDVSSPEKEHLVQ